MNEERADVPVDADRGPAGWHQRQIHAPVFSTKLEDCCSWLEHLVPPPVSLTRPMLRSLYISSSRASVKRSGALNGKCTLARESVTKVRSFATSKKCPHVDSTIYQEFGRPFVTTDSNILFEACASSFSLSRGGSEARQGQTSTSSSRRCCTRKHQVFYPGSGGNSTSHQCWWEKRQCWLGSSDLVKIVRISLS